MVIWRDEPSGNRWTILNGLPGYLKATRSPNNACLVVDYGRFERNTTFVGKKENWKPPNGQSIKINFDALFDCLGLKSTSRIVARNANEEVLASNSCLHMTVGTTFDVEALTCFEVVLIGIDLGLTDVIVEGDSRSIINKCNKRLVDKS
ncbi:hypothetical protein Goshw_009860 [Gossypium schwendimanii]|uniref:RNase H type-1 domain-containing protein n=1 Tax=Gossypium schwendimanii TaxID=34291 RepID=A0A7J9MCK9_GOSSC|nr:hypothetical protein [Gossypium schwendimanii]